MNPNSINAITFRAELEQPIGPLNPLGARVAAAVHVEVYRSAGKWAARSLRSRAGELVPCGELPIAAAPGPDTAMRAVDALFERRRSSWKPVRNGEQLELEPRAADEHPKPRQYTHYSRSGDDGRKGGRLFTAACGEVADFARIKSVRGQELPNCPKCLTMREEILRAFAPAMAARRAS